MTIHLADETGRARCMGARSNRTFWLTDDPGKTDCVQCKRAHAGDVLRRIKRAERAPAPACVECGRPTETSPCRLCRIPSKAGAR